MSYSTSVAGKLSEIPAKLHAAIEASNYGDAQEAVLKHTDIAADTVEALSTTLGDEGEFSVSFYGHANYGESDGVRDQFTLSLNPINATVYATEDTGNQDNT